MFPNRLEPGNVYKLNTGYRVRYIGDNTGINLATSNKVKVSRKNVTSRIVDRDWMRGCAEALGCKVLDNPNGALHVVGSEAALSKIVKVIETTHRFYPATYLSRAVDGVEEPGYPRIEIHPSMVYDRL